jgi:hypothetical protein
MVSEITRSILNVFFAHRVVSFETWCSYLLDEGNGSGSSGTRGGVTYRKDEGYFYNWINPNFQNVLIRNVNKIEFENLYPDIIHLLIEKGTLEFNSEKFKNLILNILNITTEEVDEYICDNHRTLGELKSFVRCLYYNITNSPCVNYRCTNPDLIKKLLKNIFDTLIEKFEKDICVIKTDEIYYIGTIDPNFYEIINSYNLPYSKNRYDLSDNLKLTENVFENLNNSNLDENLIHLLINDVRKFRLESVFNEIDDEIESNLAYFYDHNFFIIFDYNMNVLYRDWDLWSTTSGISGTSGSSGTREKPYDELYYKERLRQGLLIKRIQSPLPRLPTIKKVLQMKDFFILIYHILFHNILDLSL